MKFASPDMLWFPAVIGILLVVFYWWARKKRAFLISQFVQSRLLASLTVGVSARRQLWRHWLMITGVTLIVLSLARPYWSEDWEESQQQGLDIIVAVDTSRSMLAMDISPDRLTRTKLAIRDLVDSTKTDRLGLVAFAGSAFLQCPLTADKEAFQQNVNILNVDIIPEPGSDIGAAIETAVNGFEKGEGTHRAIVLFTDGEDHVNKAMDAAELAQREGVHLFTIGVGTPGGELLQYINRMGQTEYIRDGEGNPINSRLNESLLQQIAGTAEGFYLPLNSTDAMKTLYERGLAPLPRGETASRQIRSPVERYQWPLAIGMLLVIAELFVSDRRRPRRGKGDAPKPLWQTLILFLFTGSSLMAASASSARDAYDRGNFSEAYQSYLKLQEESPDDARLRYNAGAAAYEAGNFGEATRQFKQSLRTTDLELQQRGYYNVGNALYRQGADLLEENRASLDAPIELWTEAVKQYENAIQLDEADQMAKHNKAFVEKMLMQLQQQREQQQQQQQNQQQQNQDGQDPNDGESGESGEQNDGDGDQPNNQGQPQPQPDAPQQRPGDGQFSQQQPPGGPGQEQEDGGSREDTENNPMNPNDQVAYFGEMTAEQARQLLDDQKADENAMLFLPRNRTNRVDDPRKNW